MNVADFYKASQERFSCSYFKQNEYPEKQLINKIINESLKITPVFSNKWHHKVDIYGPEFYEEKRKVCIQTVENTEIRKMYDSRLKSESGIFALYDYLEDFENIIKSGKIKESFTKGYAYKGDWITHLPDNIVTFNTQVMAPYLLKFTMVPNTFGTAHKGTSSVGINLKGHQSAMAQAFAISIIATHYGVDVGFCGCLITNDENKNLIWYNDKRIMFFVGLGYTDENCYKSKKFKSRPNFNDICTWQ
tara:strand:+ start:3535 stop:4275 length:741 start_codon:yes stop_codon:yes gene_type:complete